MVQLQHSGSNHCAIFQPGGRPPGALTMTMRAWKISDDMPSTVGVEPRYTDTKYNCPKNFRKTLDGSKGRLGPPTTRWHMEVLKSVDGDPVRHSYCCRRFDGHFSLGDTYAVGMIVLIRQDATAAWQKATIAELGFSFSHRKRPLRFDSPAFACRSNGWVALEHVRKLPTCLATDINDLSTGRLCMDIAFGVAFLAVPKWPGHMNSPRHQQHCLS